MLLQLASNDVSSNQTVMSAILNEVSMIKKEIEENAAELNSVIGTPQKSNQRGPC